MRKIILVVVALAGIAGCSSAVKQSGVSEPGLPPIVVPRTILLRGDGLAESKRALARGDEEVTASFVSLLSAAMAAYSAPSLSVMQKKHVPPSGNKHDYMSMAPYWWPDTTKPNGLPFIRRDGEMYPDSRTDHDGIRLQQTIERVEALALTWYFTDDPRYSRAAAKHLRVFFLDSATRMNPNLEYAQAVLGVNTGRGTGLIDTRTIPDLVDALRLLEGSPGWTAADAQAMTAWCREYLKWMLNSKNGKEERAATNNHGTFYDEQIIALALFVGDSANARTFAEGGKARIEAQIKADGKQPQELERTRPLHYSVFNLDAFSMLAEMSRHVGVDLWHYTAPGGGSLKGALLFVAPYADSTVKFPMPEVTPEGTDIFVVPFRRGAAALGDPALTKAITHLSQRVRRADVSRFGFPAMP
jgi:hypothetical protein